MNRLIKDERFTEGEYVRKEDVMTYLRCFDWDMPREKLMEKFKDIASINLTEQDVNKVIINKMLNCEI